MKQERNLLLTTNQLCNVKKKEFQRRIKIPSMKGLSRSTQPGNMEFVVHVKNEYDYRFICEERDKLFLQIKAVYFNKMNQNLPIYDVPENLKNYATSKKEIKDAIEKMPPESYRNKAEDIYEPFDPTQNSTRSTASSLNLKNP